MRVQAVRRGQVARQRRDSLEAERRQRDKVEAEAVEVVRSIVVQVNEGKREADNFERVRDSGGLRASAAMHLERLGLLDKWDVVVSSNLSAEESVRWLSAGPRASEGASTHLVDFGQMEAGEGVLHLGGQFHETLPLEEGERLNLVLWMFARHGVVRVAPYPNEQRVGATERWGAYEAEEANGGVRNEDAFEGGANFYDAGNGEGEVECVTEETIPADV